MLTEQEYKRRVDENTAELKRQTAAGSFDITKFHGFDIEKGILQPVKLLRKTHDIFAAAILGFLAYLDEHSGADGVMLEDGVFVDLEFKTCYTHISPKHAFKTAQGTVYFTKDVYSWPGDWIDRNKIVIAKSQFKASFDIKHNLHTKERRTFLICFDGSTGEIVCAYSMEGAKVLEFLATSRDIKLGSFMNEGTEITNLVIPSIGWDTWLDRHKSALETRRSSTKAEEDARLAKVARGKAAWSSAIARFQEQGLNSSSTHELAECSQVIPKNHPNEQTAILYTECDVTIEIEVQPDTLPTSLSD